MSTENKEISEVFKTELFNKQTDNQVKISNIGKLLEGANIPNPLEVSQRLVTVSQIPWFLTSGKHNPNWIRKQVNSVVDGLASYGDPEKVEVEIISDWDEAEKRMLSGKEFRYEDDIYYYKKIFLISSWGFKEKIHCQRCDCKTREFSSKGFNSLWRSLTGPLIGSIVKPQEAVETVDRLAKIAVEEPRWGLHSWFGIQKDFKEAYYDPAWEKEKLRYEDDGYRYFGNFKGLLSYYRLEKEWIFKEPTDIALLYVGMALVDKFWKSRLPDSASRLISLYQKGYWPLGLTHTNESKVPVFSVLIPPESITRRLDLIAQLTKSLPEVSTCIINSDLENSLPTRSISISLDATKTTDNSVQKLLKNYPNFLRRKVNLDGLGQINFTVSRQVNDSSSINAT